MRFVRAAAGIAGLIAVAALCGAAVAEPAEPAPAQSPPAEAPAAEAPPAASVPITWDREANIKEAAERIGLIQRTRGAEGAIKHIDACYRTHGLASAYSAPFEACIAQDYMETKLLTRIYGRMPAEKLRQMGAPTADLLANAMARRVVAAFRQYKVSAADADAFKVEVDKIGMPVFLKTVFPNAAAEIDALGGKFHETEKPDETSKEKKN